MQSDIFFVLNTIGVLAFAFAGSIRAMEEGLDLLGIFTLGIVTATGGGIVRDVLINRIPYAFLSSPDVLTAAGGTVLAMLVLGVWPKGLMRTPTLLFCDALGLAAFTATGAMIAHHEGLSGFGIVAIAAVTAVGGGVLGDLLCCKVPAILKEDFYATCSISGAAAFNGCAAYFYDVQLGYLLCCGVVFSLRMLAIIFRWRLPKFKRFHLATQKDRLT